VVGRVAAHRALVILFDKRSPSVRYAPVRSPGNYRSRLVAPWSRHVRILSTIVNSLYHHHGVLVPKNLLHKRRESCTFNFYRAGTPAGSFDTLRFNNLGKRLTLQRASDGISTPVRAFLSPIGVCATPRAYRVGYLVLVNSLTDLSHVHSPGVQPSSRGRVTPTWMPFS
jgi:hypothetical protein